MVSVSHGLVKHSSLGCSHRKCIVTNCVSDELIVKTCERITRLKKVYIDSGHRTYFSPQPLHPGPNCTSTSILGLRIEVVKERLAQVLMGDKNIVWWSNPIYLVILICGLHSQYFNTLIGGKTIYRDKDHTASYIDIQQNISDKIQKLIAYLKLN